MSPGYWDTSRPPRAKARVSALASNPRRLRIETRTRRVSNSLNLQVQSWLATLFSSFFKQSILKKKSKSTTVTKEDACMSRSSISLIPHVIKNTWKQDKCVALDSEERVKNERSKSADGNSTNKWLLELDMEAKLWSEELFRKEERWWWRKSEEEDEGSESSSDDLFELQNYDSIDGVSTNPWDAINRTTYLYVLFLWYIFSMSLSFKLVF